MTVKELKAKAKELGLKGYSKLRKAELEELLKANEIKEDNRPRCKYCGEVIELVTKNYIQVDDLEDWETDGHCGNCGSERVNGEWIVGETDIIEDKIKEVIEQVNELYKHQEVTFTKGTNSGVYITINNPAWEVIEADYISYNGFDIKTLAEDYLISEVE